MHWRTSAKAEVAVGVEEESKRVKTRTSPSVCSEVYCADLRLLPPARRLARCRLPPCGPKPDRLRPGLGGFAPAWRRRTDWEKQLCRYLLVCPPPRFLLLRSPSGPSRWHLSDGHRRLPSTRGRQRVVDLWTTVWSLPAFWLSFYHSDSSPSRFCRPPPTPERRSGRTGRTSHLWSSLNSTDEKYRSRPSSCLAVCPPNSAWLRSDGRSQTT